MFLKEKAVWIPQTGEGDSLNGFPVYAVQGEDERWRLYMRQYPDPELDPEAWVLVPLKGYRSQAIGDSLAELVADYLRGIDLGIQRDLALEELRAMGLILGVDPEWQALEAIITATGNGIEIDEARQIRSFAQEVVRLSYMDVEAAYQLLDRELKAPYGRARRQDAILDALPELEHTDSGNRFFCLRRATDLDAWLAGALAWIDSAYPVNEPETDETQTNQPEEAEEEVTEEMLRQLQDRFKKSW